MSNTPVPIYAFLFPIMKRSIYYQIFNQILLYLISLGLAATATNFSMFYGKTQQKGVSQLLQYLDQVCAMKARSLSNTARGSMLYC